MTLLYSKISTVSISAISIEVNSKVAHFFQDEFSIREIIKMELGLFKKYYAYLEQTEVSHKLVYYSELQKIMITLTVSKIVTML